MKLLLDEGLPLRAAARLRDAGLESNHAIEMGLNGRVDEIILAKAAELGAVVVTLDSDFHTILASWKALRPSVIRIRIEGLKDEAAASLILQVVSQVGQALEMGAAVTVTPWQIRIRRLPLKR